jgi:hypothetical protein
MLGAFDARGLVDQNTQRFAGAVQAIGEKACIGFMQGMRCFFRIGSLGHDISFCRETQGGASGGLAGAN